MTTKTQEYGIDYWNIEPGDRGVDVLRDLGIDLDEFWCGSEITVLDTGPYPSATWAKEFPNEPPYLKPCAVGWPLRTTGCKHRAMYRLKVHSWYHNNDVECEDTVSVCEFHIWHIWLPESWTANDKAFMGLVTFDQEQWHCVGYVKALTSEEAARYVGALVVPHTKRTLTKKNFKVVECPILTSRSAKDVFWAGYNLPIIGKFDALEHEQQLTREEVYKLKLAVSPNWNEKDPYWGWCKDTKFRADTSDTSELYPALSGSEIPDRIIIEGMGND